MFCSCLNDEYSDAKRTYMTYCGNCHLPVDPQNIPKNIWEEKVLPEMGARLGYKYKNYNPLANKSMEENFYIGLSNTYPKKSTINSSDWNNICNYIMKLAPDTIPADTFRNQRNAELRQFKFRAQHLNQAQLSNITYINFQPSINQFLIGDETGKLLSKGGNRENFLLRAHSPIMNYQRTNNKLFITEIGNMNPSEIPLGVIYTINNTETDTIVKQLHRPVFSEVVDIDEDGQNEILICEFGHFTGELSILLPSGGKFEKKTLFPIPGTIKFEIADLNKDGRKDIILLASQGKEGVYILYQKQDLRFQVDYAIKLSAEHGTSWFELVDYNNDNHLDIVLVNGDNVDYSIFPKPYHGVSIYLNNGRNVFKRQWFYPIYGATRVLPEDYDLDGDIDLAILAYFSEYDGNFYESLVYLQNKDSKRFQFDSFTIPHANSMRWLVMDKGDIDQDGDTDILLGSFALDKEKAFKTIKSQSNDYPPSLFLLENMVK